MDKPRGLAGGDVPACAALPAAGSPSRASGSAGLAALHPYPWGVTSMAVDRDLLAAGRFALASAADCSRTERRFSMPGETDHPTPLDLPDGARNMIVYLAVTDFSARRDRNDAIQRNRRRRGGSLRRP